MFWFFMFDLNAVKLVLLAIKVQTCSNDAAKELNHYCEDLNTKN